MGGGNTPFALAGTVIGGVIGAATGGPGGMMAGARIGATVGSVAEAVFNKPPDTAKSRDTHWGGVSFGTAIPRGWGNHRTDSFVFWAVRNSDGTYLFKHNERKSKSKAKTNVAHYHGTFAFHILDTGLTFPDGRQVERKIVVDRVWMADKVVWTNPNSAPLPAWSSTTTYAYGDYVSHSGSTYVSVGDANLNHTPPSNSNQWWQKASTSKNLNLTFHPDPDSGESTFTMGPSSVIASHEGVANTTNMRGSTYGVADDVDLFDLGNALPFSSVRTDWHFADPDYTLGDFLSDVCGMCGMPDGSYDFSDATEAMPGYRQTSRQSGQDLVGQPLSVLGYDLATVDGVVRAIKRGGAVSAVIDVSELGATLEGQSLGDDSEGDLLSEDIPTDRRDLHSSLKLGYYNASAGYRNSFQTATRNDYTVENPTDLATDLVLTDEQAAQAAGRILDTEYIEAGGAFGASLPGSRSGICGADPITVPYRDVPTRFRVTKTQMILGLMRLTLTRDEASVMTRYESAASTPAAAADSATIVPTAFAIASPSGDLSNAFAAYAGFYVWANGPFGWIGGGVAFTFDAPSAPDRNWVDGGFISDASIFATASGALADATAAGFETSSTVSIKVQVASAMEVEPSTYALVSNGAQNALLGSEFVGVVAASDVGGGSFQIGPGLIRGLRGSAFTGHVAGELFAMAPSIEATTKIQVDDQYVGQTVYVRVLSPGQDINDSPELSCVIAAPTPPYVTSLPTSVQETPAGIVDGTNASFSLSHTPIAGSLALYVGGALQDPTSYTLTGASVTFSAPPASGSVLFAQYQTL